MDRRRPIIKIGQKILHHTKRLAVSIDFTQIFFVQCWIHVPFCPLMQQPPRTIYLIVYVKQEDRVLLLLLS